MLFVYQGAVDQGPMFFDRHMDDVEAIADPDGALYAMFEVERGGIAEMFGLRAWVSGLRATAKGYFINRKIGDPWTMPTIYAVHEGNIVWEHRGTHAGDHPDVRAIPNLIASST